jgi:hypothetical protein
MCIQLFSVLCMVWTYSNLWSAVVVDFPKYYTVACFAGTLQKLGCNVMYQAGLHDNPQMDVQGAQRIIRTGHCR